MRVDITAKALQVGDEVVWGDYLLPVSFIGDPKPHPRSGLPVFVVEFDYPGGSKFYATPNTQLTVVR